MRHREGGTWPWQVGGVGAYSRGVSCIEKLFGGMFIQCLVRGSRVERMSTGSPSRREDGSRAAATSGWLGYLLGGRARETGGGMGWVSRVEQRGRQG